MLIEFTTNELHTIAGTLYPYLNSDEDLHDTERAERRTLVLEIGRCIINGTSGLDVTEREAWDIRDHVPYSAMMGAETTGRSIHLKLWTALLLQVGYTPLHFGDVNDTTYQSALDAANTRTDKSS